MALNSLFCADVPLSNYSLTHLSIYLVPSSTRPLWGLYRTVLEFLKNSHQFHR